MVFVTFEYWRNRVAFPLSHAGPSCMADNIGSIDCWWLDSGIPETQITMEDRRVTASTNDATGRTADTFIEGPVSSTD
jgi:hypothetical protein